jgi:hypothetical protein
MVHGSMVDRGKGVYPDLICVVHLRLSGWGSPRAASARQRFTGTSPEVRRQPRSWALVHGFKFGFVLREVEELVNLSRPKVWRLG